MKTLQNIREEFARTNGYFNWEDCVLDGMDTKGIDIIATAYAKQFIDEAINSVLRNHGTNPNREDVIETLLKLKDELK